MRIIDKVEVPAQIKDVKFKRLKPATDQFAVMLDICYELVEGFRIMVKLYDGDRDMPIEFADKYFPGKLIPPFAIDVKCFFEDYSDEMDWVCENAIAAILAENATITFSHNGDHVEVHLDIKPWFTDGGFDFTEASGFLVRK